MVRFMRKWLVPLLAVLLLIGVAIAFVPFSRQMETRAKTELTLLMDRAFARIAAGDQLVDPIVEAEEESLLSKAVAVSRFLTHDDSLLASDALAALCEQLSIDRIDVADADGTLIASSSAANVGTALGTQEAYAWAMAAAEDPTAQLTQQDTTDESLLYACVGRSDIEGFILLTRDDAHVESVLMLSNPESITSDLPYGGDVLFTAEKGDDGFFYESNNLCLRRTQDGVTMIAARPSSEVFAVRNAALLAFAAALACIMICGVAAYLINLEVVSTSDDGEIEQNESVQEQALPEEETAYAALPEEQEKPRRRFQKKRERIAEQAELPVETEVEIQHEQSMEHAPRQVMRGKKKTHAAKEESELQNDEDAFEKIVD